jgi:hypothetical protein
MGIVVINTAVNLKVLYAELIGMSTTYLRTQFQMHSCKGSLPIVIKFKAK